MDMSMALRRMRVPERMDDPALPAQAHEAALHGLARLNGISLAHRVLWPRIRRLADRLGGSLHILDVASGAADLPARLEPLARRAGLRIRWTLADCSPHALRHGLERARAAGLECDAVRVDARCGPLPQADLAMNSLLLHHFDGPDVVRILQAMHGAARHAVGVTDLRRTRTALGLVWLGSRVLTRSDVVHHDATASVRAAHEPDELGAMVAEAGLHDARIEPAGAVRWRLWWERGPGAAA
jgi:hypothetical protein